MYLKIKIEKTPAFFKGRISLHIMILWIAVSSFSAATGPDKHGSKNIALGYAVTAMGNNAWSLFSNPACAPRMERTLGLYCSPQPFGLSELALGSLVYQEPFPFGTLGCGAYSQGFELYRESGAVLGFAAPVSDTSVIIGISVCYTNLSIRGYGSAGTFVVNTGAAVRVEEGVLLGASVLNLNQATIGAQVAERLPVCFVLGVSGRPLSTVIVFLDAFKDVRYPVDFRCGFEYMPLEALALRAGTSTDPSSMTGGIGIRAAGISVDYAYGMHTDLGPTHSISVSVSLGRK
jgi:hypothetical protein